MPASPDGIAVDTDARIYMLSYQKDTNIKNRKKNKNKTGKQKRNLITMKTNNNNKHVLKTVNRYQLATELVKGYSRGYLKSKLLQHLKRISFMTTGAIEYRSFLFRDGPLANLWGGGGRRSTKKYSCKGKLNEKQIHARQLTLKNIHAMA